MYWGNPYTHNTVSINTLIIKNKENEKLHYKYKGKKVLKIPILLHSYAPAGMSLINTLT